MFLDCREPFTACIKSRTAGTEATDRGDRMAKEIHIETRAAEDAGLARSTQSASRWAEHLLGHVQGNVRLPARFGPPLAVAEEKLLVDLPNTPRAER